MIPPQLRDSLTTPSIIGSSLKTESINNIQLDHSLDNIVIDPSVSGNCSYLSPPKSSCDSFSTPYPRYPFSFLCFFGAVLNPGSNGVSNPVFDNSLSIFIVFFLIVGMINTRMSFFS